MLSAYNAAQSVTRMGLQGLVTQGKVDWPYAFNPVLKRKAYDKPPEQVQFCLETSTKVNFIKRHLDKLNEICLLWVFYMWFQRRKDNG